MLALYVDDDPDDVFLFEKAWRSVAPTSVCLDTLDGGRAALRYLDAAEGNARRLPDLLLVDLKMPELSGPEVVRLVKARPSFMHIPAIVLTSSLLARDAAEAVSAGALACITKPTRLGDIRSLASRIAEWMLAGMDLRRLPVADLARGELPRAG